MSIRKCLFPVAGSDTVFLPATRAMPKEMLPVAYKPLIQYGVEEACDAGLTQMLFVTGRGGQMVEEHFDIDYELEHLLKGSGTARGALIGGTLRERCVFAYIRQGEAKGLGHAILAGQPVIGDEPFAVVLADDLCVNPGGDPVLLQMLNLYKQYRCSIVAIQEVSDEEISRYGVIAGDVLRDDLYRVTHAVEKPSPEDAPSHLAIVGRFILTPDIFGLIAQSEPDRHGLLQLTGALQKQAGQGRLLALRITGKRFDCGRANGYVEAINYCFKHSCQDDRQGANQALRETCL